MSTTQAANPPAPLVSLTEDETALPRHGSPVRRRKCPPAREEDGRGRRLRTLADRPVLRAWPDGHRSARAVWRWRRHVLRGDSRGGRTVARRSLSRRRRRCAEHAGQQRPAALDHRRPEEALPAADVQGHGRCLCAQRSQFRLRRFRLADPRRTEGQRVRAQRTEAVDHQRQGGGRFHSAGHRRSVCRIQRHHGLHRRENFPGLCRRQERRQARHPRLQHLRADSGRLPRAQGQCAGRGRQGLQDRDRDAERRPHRYRRANARPGARRVGVRRQVRAGAQAVRQAPSPSSRASSSRSRRWRPRSKLPACCSTTALA